MTATIIYGLLFVTGLWLIFRRPLAKATGLPPYWEVGIGALLVIAFTIHLTGVLVMEPAMEAELAKRPCGADSPQGHCYSLEQSICESAWHRAEVQCKEELAGVLKDRPSALIGPALNRCRARRMDQVLKYNRAHTDTPYCKAYFAIIEAK